MVVGKLPCLLTRPNLIPVGLVIFTDLDGTLLDAAYSFLPAAPALEAVRRTFVPMVICSSKTRREIESYRIRLGNHDPFIAENGGAVYVPEGYFTAAAFAGLRTIAPQAADPVETVGGYEIIRLGAPYARLRSALAAFREDGLRVTGYGDMSAIEIAAATGLPPEEAVMAKEREFDEPFYLEGNGRAQARVTEAARRTGLHVSGRGPFHLTGGNDKGKAVSLLCALFKKTTDRTTFAALGDGPTDLPMLRVVDRPVIVRRPDGTYDPDLENKGFAKADGVGPEGWNKAVLELLAQQERTET